MGEVLGRARRGTSTARTRTLRSGRASPATRSSGARRPPPRTTSTTASSSPATCARGTSGSSPTGTHPSWWAASTSRDGQGPRTARRSLRGTTPSTRSRSASNAPTTPGSSPTRSTFPRASHADARPGGAAAPRPSPSRHSSSRLPPPRRPARWPSRWRTERSATRRSSAVPTARPPTRAEEAGAAKARRATWGARKR